MRNRVIKAEFWADEKIGSCSFIAQLLFIGSWNFADDSGVCRANSLYLRNNIFPYSSLTTKQIDEALEQLRSKNLISVGQYENEKYFLIKNFAKHQKIDRPSKFRYISAQYVDIFDFEEKDNTTRRVIDEDSSTKVKEKVNVKVKEKVVEHEEEQEDVQKSEFDFYGEYKNVGLTKSQYGKLTSFVLNAEKLNEIIEDFGKKIEVGKEPQFRENLPNAHFVRLMDYWNFRRKNLQKFREQAPEDNKKEVKQKWTI